MGDDEQEGRKLKGMARSIGNLFDSFDDMAAHSRPASEIDPLSHPAHSPDDMPLIPKVEADIGATVVVDSVGSQPEPTPELEPPFDPGQATRPSAPSQSPSQVADGDEDPGPPQHPLAITLDAAVSEFLLGASAQRTPLADAVRSAFDEAKAANLLDVLVEAVNSLVVQPMPDPVGEALGKELMNATVESRMAIHLGTVREERRRTNLIQVYAGMGDSMAEAVSEALSATDDRLARRTYVALLVEMREAGIRVVERMVDDSRWWVARNGVAVLGEIGGAAAITMLTSTLANDDARVRKETVLSLAKIGGEDAGMLAMGMLSDGDSDVRATASRAMAVLKVERALKPLLEMLANEDDPLVVERVLRALGEIGDPSAVQAIEKKAVGGLLRKSPTDVRVAAYTALAAIGTPKARALVESAVEDRDTEVRLAAQAALRGLSG